MAGTPKTGGFEYLKTLAVSRIYLDNIPNIQSSWVTQGDKVGQMALLYGANDMGSTMLEENVVSQAGATFRMTEATIRRVIADLGFEPRRRNMYYQLLES
jgi:cyclic dehypoxanthinyl futalosine synthase